MNANLYFAVLFALLLSLTAGSNTGFWYGDVRPPISNYETIAFAQMTVRIDLSYQDGPGQNLMKDPYDFKKSLYVGNTINRQAFDTQFILDMSYALGIDTHRVYVTGVSKGKVHFSWESSTVIVQFIFLERNQTTLYGSTLLEAIALLTQQVQNTDTKVYKGNITRYIDPLWGVQVTGWDVSLKLSYAIEVVGGDAVQMGYYLNQGGLGLCDLDHTAYAKYCEFERFFEDDVSRALNISSYRIQILFIKLSSFDSVLVHFRITPPKAQLKEKDVPECVANLHLLVADPTSLLYDGNVTIRVDPTWGVDGAFAVQRSSAAKFTKQHYEIDPVRLADEMIVKTFVTPYDRCKANRRCNWGVVDHDQSTNDVLFYQQLYQYGMLYKIDLFLDFEDWRLGARGFSWKGSIPPTKLGATSIPRARANDAVIRGAHFNPFLQRSLGPDIPCLLQERNQGLVLDRTLQVKQIYEQNALIRDIKGRIDWLEENIEWAVMDAELRSRKDVRANLTWVKADFTHWWENEVDELKQLSSSQCVFTTCRITFNTSSLQLTGAINDTGVVRLTPGGTEVAVFSFNSILLGPETEIVVVGQRALSIISKSTFVLNTTIHAHPGTLGGFRGGESVARLPNENLNDNPQSIYICDLGKYCQNNRNFSNLVSNNVNGPGSGNLRVRPFVVVSSARSVEEVQVITTSAKTGQTLAGGFVLHFRGYSTSLIPFDASQEQMKQLIEDNLNIAPPANSPVLSQRDGKAIAGVGIVDVSRAPHGDSQGGFTWSVTFTTAVGNIEQMTVTSYLMGLLAQVTVRTAVEGNELRGSFTLAFQGGISAPISVKESAEGMRQKLLTIPAVSTAYVIRNDPTNNCDDGLCPNGPYPSRGMMWTIYITTDSNNGDVTPTSPTSPVTGVEAPDSRIVPNIDNLQGLNASVDVYYGSSAATDQMLAKLTITRPFSLAFGGAGASYGGSGGSGYAFNKVGPKYNDDRLTDLLGGSGGCMRSVHPYEVNSLFGPPSGRGGHGGAAIELVAANDLIIGSQGVISVRGEDGQQSSGGGGGGGSGGAILLSAGGTIVNDGTMDISGGNGGFGGFGFEHLSGGGGGGGRLAMFAESIINNGKYIRDGGQCGAYRIPVTVSAAVVQMSISLKMITIPLDDHRLGVMAATVVNKTVETMFVEPLHVHRIADVAIVQLNVTFDVNNTIAAMNKLYPSFTADAFNATLSLMKREFLKKKGLEIGSLVFGHMTVDDVTYMDIYPTVAKVTKCSNNGQPGSIFSEATMTTSMYVRETAAAEGTKKALFFSNNEMTNTSSGSSREAPFSWNGPIMPFEPSQPNRITYYSRIDTVPGQASKSNFGALFSLLSRGVEGLNVSSVIGVFIGDRISHGANFGSAVDEKAYLKRSVTMWSYPVTDRWYKVDIHISWSTHTYTILLDDSIVIQNAPFKGDDVDGIRVSVSRSVNVWFDEIYVGFDNMQGFTCPFTDRTGTSTLAPEQKHWSYAEVHGGGSGFTAYNKMTRHYNHLDPTGSIPFDGQGAVNDNQDIKFSYDSGDMPIQQGKLHAGSLRYLTNTLRSAKTAPDAAYTLASPNGLWYAPGNAGDGRQFWYTEYNTKDAAIPSLNGGVAACSSQDLLTWRFDGFVFQYANLSDMVFGSQGPFFLERPKVQQDKKGVFVMWAAMDNSQRSLAMTAVATSPFEDGPFYFRRSFYPDGNKTRDQVVFIDEYNRPILARTYFQTVEYLMPAAIMQPIWESVKFRNGTVNYRSSYHRAYFESGYDNYHDIFNQRWRNESKPWDVKCVNKITGVERDILPGVYTSEGTVCNDPEEYKVVNGQGNPVVPSLFLDPNSADNSWWVQSSVPAVGAQPWASSYRDGYCGIRLLNDNHEENDPNLASFSPENRSTCSNIADNPIHISLQDKLIGVQRVITTRRAKFLAMSQLTDDYLDTTGVLTSFEGEFGTGAGVAIDLLSMIAEMGQFGLGPGEEISSTFRPPVRSEYDTADDYAYRFRQFVRNPNDRATYALACVLDGVCPVNFRDQLTTGHV